MTVTHQALGWSADSLGWSADSLGRSADALGLSAVVTTNTHTIFVAFLVFEACVGCYFPIMGAPS